MYYIVFLIGIILSTLYRKKKISFKMFAVILALVSFFRFGVGADYFSYNYLYSRLNESLIIEARNGLDSQEILFRVMGSAFKGLGLSYQQYIIILAAINLYFIYKICRRYSKNPTQSLLVYYCFYYFVWTFSGLRQGLTISIGVYYLLQCLESENVKKIILISVLLSFIHTSAIILIPLYFGARINYDRKSLIILSLIAIIISIIPIGNILAKFSWLPLISKLKPYLNHHFSLVNILDFQSLGRLIFLVIIIFYYEVYAGIDDISKKIVNIYILSLILYFLLKFSELTAARISIYGVILNIIILPNLYYMHKTKFDKLLYITLLGILCTLYFNKELYTLTQQSGLKNNSILVPYTNIFNKDEYSFKNMYYLELQKKGGK